MNGVQRRGSVLRMNDEILRRHQHDPYTGIGSRKGTLMLQESTPPLLFAPPSFDPLVMSLARPRPRDERTTPSS